MTWKHLWLPQHFQWSLNRLQDYYSPTTTEETSLIVYLPYCLKLLGLGLTRDWKINTRIQKWAFYILKKREINLVNYINSSYSVMFGLGDMFIWTHMLFHAFGVHVTWIEFWVVSKKMLTSLYQHKILWINTNNKIRYFLLFQKNQCGRCDFICLLYFKETQFVSFSFFSSDQ